MGDGETSFKLNFDHYKIEKACLLSN